MPSTWKPEGACAGGLAGGLGGVAVDGPGADTTGRGGAVVGAVVGVVVGVLGLLLAAPLGRGDVAIGGLGLAAGLDFAVGLDLAGGLDLTGDLDLAFSDDRDLVRATAPARDLVLALLLLVFLAPVLAVALTLKDVVFFLATMRTPSAPNSRPCHFDVGSQTITRVEDRRKMMIEIHP